MNSNSTSHSPQRLPTLTRPIRPIRSTYDNTNLTISQVLPPNPYGLDLQSTRTLVANLTHKVNALQKQINEMTESHEIAELETQMQIYAMDNIIKDYEEYTDGGTYATK